MSDKITYIREEYNIPEARVIIKDNLVFIDKQEYIIETNYKDAINEKDLAQRYTQLLQKYDYIVGDWGHEQLRLKGFYRTDNVNVPQEQQISALEDYLYEYCAFDCAYFVLKLNGNPIPVKPEISNTNKRKRQPKKYFDKNETPIIENREIVKQKMVIKNEKKSKKPKIKSVSEKTNNVTEQRTKMPAQKNKRHGFIIRTKGDR